MATQPAFPDAAGSSGACEDEGLVKSRHERVIPSTMPRRSHLAPENWGTPLQRRRLQGLGVFASSHEASSLDFPALECIDQGQRCSAVLMPRKGHQGADGRVAIMVMVEEADGVLACFPVATYVCGREQRAPWPVSPCCYPCHMPGQPRPAQRSASIVTPDTTTSSTSSRQLEQLKPLKLSLGPYGVLVALV